MRPVGLILSGSIGKGHDSVAEACALALKSTGFSPEVLDCMQLLGGAESAMGTAVFRRLISIPSVYDSFHFSHLRSGRTVPRLLGQASDRRLVKALREQVQAHWSTGEEGILIPVFPTGVSAAACLKAARPGVAAVVVCTDACVHRLWVAHGIDGYIVCSQLAAATVWSYDPSAAIAILPPPVRSGFYSAPDQAQARAALGIPAGEPCALIMAGSWGLASLTDAAAGLARAGYWVLAVAGMNNRLYDDLLSKTRELSQLVPFAFSDRVPELMAAADVVVTSAGQTCNEARVIGRPLIILDVVPGHGRENCLHEIESGAALTCLPEAGLVVGLVNRLLKEGVEVPRWPVGSADEWNQLFGDALQSFGISAGC